ncbi:MAG: hypothetical protein R3272_15625 [Candidatus Promineifilaceae bacterium]|nr:hypothetical protein [Candidatus Promineifilaceae bacterium]
MSRSVRLDFWLLILFAAAFPIACRQQPAPAGLPLPASPTAIVATETAQPTATATTAATGTPAPSPTVAAAGEDDLLPEEPVDVLPEILQPPTTTPPPPDELETVAAFVAQLEEVYSISPLDADAARRALRPLMDRNFAFEIHSVGRPAYMNSPQNVLGHLSFGIFRPVEPLFVTEDVAERLPPGVTPEAYYTGEQPLEAVVYSTGWGQAGEAEALLFLTRTDDGALRWAGLSLSTDNFAPLPALETVAPPPHLVYRLGDAWWQVGEEGEARLLVEHPGPLSVNPGATYALRGEAGEQSLTLFDLITGGAAVTRTLTIDYSLMLGSWYMPWLEEEMALLTVTDPAEGLSQGTAGRMALLDVTSGALQVLAPEVSIYAQPAPTDDGAIFFKQLDDLEQNVQRGAAVWREGEVTPLNLRDMAGLELEPFDVVPSPDGVLVAAIGLWPADRELVGYWMFDLEQQDAHPLLGYTPIGTDANLPQGIFWHPGGEWLALEPNSGDPLQDGVWVMRPEGGEKQFLGVGTANPLWLEEGQRLLFNATVEGEQRLQLLDLEIGERFWVNVPVGARPVQ